VLTRFSETTTAKTGHRISAPIIDGQISKPFLPVGQFPSFTVRPGKKDADGLPTSNAGLCVNGGTQCFALPTKQPDTQTKYFFGLEPKAERVTIDPADSVIFFSGTFSGGGSGILESFALLKYDNRKKIVNILPPINLVDGGDRKIWRLPHVSSMPVVVFAEHIWAEAEAHYGDHLWTISAYVFDSKSEHYAKQTEYITAPQIL